MAIMKTATVLPATRRYNPTMYISVPRLFNQPQTVQLALSGTPDPKTSTTAVKIGKIPVVTKPTVPVTARIPRPTLSYVRTPCPKVVLPLPVPYYWPPPQPWPVPIVIGPNPSWGRVMYYVYHPTWMWIGPYPVVLYNNYRVVWITPAEAAYYIGCYWIDLIPWHLRTWTTRKFIRQFTGWQIVADLPPVVHTPLEDQVGTVSTPITPYQFDADSFWDPDDATVTLTYTATQVSGAALPAWLTFTAATRTFSGTPTQAGTTSVRVRATDPWGRSVTDDFDIVVST